MKYYDINFKFSSIIIFFIVIALFSYSSVKKKEEQKLWIGKKLNIPEISSNEKKIVVRLIGDCPSCIESIKMWKKLDKIFKEKNKNFKLIFYVEVVNEKRFQELQKQLNFADYVIFDQRMSFFNKNLLSFPYHLEYHTFLLNKENKILLFGNPVVKRDLLKKYIELL